MRVTLAVLLGAAVATCRDAPTGPGRGARASLALAPVLPAQVANLAAFGLAIDSLRVVVVRPASDTVADTTVLFAADQDSLELALSIPLDESPETFNIAMELRGGGFVLFSASTPAAISAGSNAPIEITNFVYSGPGAGVTTLQVTPLDSVISFGDSLRFRVDALAGGVPVTQFYVSWSSSSAALAPINAHGVLLAPAQRAVVQVTATTPTGITATVPVTFIPVPTSVTAVPPLPQNVPALSPIGPLRVRVLAGDGLGVKGVPVTFAAVSGGGSVTNSLVATDSGGYAETGATSGATGTSVYSATVAGLTAVTLNVIVLGQTGTHLAFAFPPAGAIVDQPFAAAVEVRDSAGVVVATATDPITIALGTNPGGAVLGGTLTVNAVQGIAVFADLTLDQVATGYTLVATAPGLTQATTPPFDVIAGFTGRLWTNAAGGNWSSPGNWSDSIVPAPGDTVYIALDGDYTVTLDVNVSVGALFIGGASGTQTLTGISRTLQVDSMLTLGPTAVLDLVGSTVGGPASSVLNQGSVRFQNTPLAAATMLNFTGASFLARGTTGVSGTLVNAIGGTVRVEGDPTCCSTAFTAGEFSNSGVVELTSIIGSSTNVSLAVLGELANAPGGTIAILPGTGGTRLITAELNNLGVFQVDYDVILSAAGAAHQNSGTVQLGGGNLTVNQAGLESFHTDGLVVIGAGRTLTINGGTLDYDSPAPGGIAGLGTLSLSGVTFAMDTDLGNDTLNLNFLNTQVQGSATLTSAAARTLTVQGTGIAVPFVNQGTFVVLGTSSLSGTVTTVGGSTMRLVGDPSCCNTTLTVASGFTNDGWLELTSTGGSTTNVALVVSTGTFFNSGTLAVLPGTGGGRTVTAQLANSGTVLIGQNVAFDASNVDYLNTGLIHLTTGNLTLNQSGGTPTFAANGPITVDAGRTFTVNGGLFQYTNVGELGGLGSVAFNATTVSLVATSLTHDTLALSFLNATVNGPGTLVNAVGRTLTIQATAVNAPFVNFGQLIVKGSTSLLGGVVTNSGSTIQVLSDPTCCNTDLTIAGSFTNNGLLEMTQTNGPTANGTLIVPSGFLVNASEATIAIRAGTGGGRTVQAALNNQGTILIEHDVTLDATSADHVNSGLIQLSGGSLNLPQNGTTPTFTTTGDVIVGTGRTLAVTGGVVNYQNLSPGGLAGLGTVSFNGAVFNVTPSISNDSLGLSFLNTVISGPGTLTNALGRTLELRESALNAPLVNLGTLLVRGTTSLGSTVTAAAGGTIRVEGDPGCCNTALSVANSFTNHGLIELTSVNGSATNVSMDVAGGLTNGPDGTLAIRAGSGGGRALPTAFVNNGQMIVEATATIGTANASYVNSGTLTVTGGIVTLPLAGTTPVFTNQGLFSVAAGATLAVTGGAGGSFVNATSGTLAGAGTFDVSATSFTNNGTVAPGGSPGALTFSGAYAMSPSAVLSVEIGGITPGTQYDQVVVNGTGTLGGTLNVTLINGFTPTIGQVFTVVSGASVSGLLASLNLPSVAGAIWLPSVGGTGLQLSLVSASALIPVVWTGGGGDGLWGTGANWSTLSPPGSGDSAVINIGGPVTVTVNTTATAAFLDIGTVVGNGAKTLVVNSSTLTLTTGGIVGGDGVVNLSAGALTGGGTLQVDGAFNWTGGQIAGAGVLQVGAAGALTLSGTGAKTLNSRTIQAAGPVTWSGTGAIGSGGGATLRVLSGGTFFVNGDASFIHNQGGGQPRVIVEPGGTLARSIGTGIVNLSVPLENAGAVQVNTGTLELRGGGANSGSFVVGTGAQLDFPSGIHTFASGAQFTGAGLTRVVGATLTMDAAASVVGNRLHLVSGVLQGAGELVAQDSLVWSGGSMSGTGPTRIPAGADLLIAGSVTLNGRSIVNEGVVTWTAGNINAGNNAAIQNLPGGLVDLRADASWFHNQGGAPPRLENSGAVQRNAGIGQLDLRAALNNSGTVHVQSGTLALNGGGTSDGTFTGNIGAELAFGGTHALLAGSSIAAEGLVSFLSGTTTFAGSYDVNGQTIIAGGSILFNQADTARLTGLEMQSGTLGGSGVVLVRGAGNWTGGTLTGTGVLRIPAGVTLDVFGPVTFTERTIANAGQIVWASGNISSGNGALLNNEAGAVFDARGTGSWFHNLGGPIPLVNNVSGTVRRSVSTGAVTFGVPVANGSVLDVQTGTVVLNAGTTSSGAHVVAAGATLNYAAGTHVLSTGADLNGAGRVLVGSGTVVSIAATAPDTVDARWIELNGGTIGGTGAVRVLDSLIWTGGQLVDVGVVRIPASGHLAIRGVAGKTLRSRTIANAGIVSWSGTGPISSGEGAGIVIENGATFQLESDANWLYNLGGVVPHVTNLTGGVIKRNGATSDITVGAALNNDGILDLQTGSVTFTGGGSSKGTLLVTAPGTLGLGGGNFGLDVASAVTGTGSFHVSAGSVTVVGDYNPTGLTRISGGGIAFDGSKPAEITTLDLSGGTLGGLGLVNLHGGGTWSGGTLTGTGPFRVLAGASLTIDGTATKVFTQRTIQNDGVVTWKGTGAISSGLGAVLSNQTGGTFEANADAGAGWFYNQGGVAPTVNNAGSLKRNAGTGTASIQAALNNSGNVDLSTGTLSLTGGGSSTGFFGVSSGAVLDFGGGTHTLSGTTSRVNGAGSATFTGGAVTFSSTAPNAYDITGTTSIEAAVTFDTPDTARFTNLLVRAGSLGGTAHMVVRGSGLWTGGTITAPPALPAAVVLRVPQGVTFNISGTGTKQFSKRTILNFGTVNWAGGSVVAGNGATLDVQAAGLFDVSAPGAWSLGAGTAFIQIARDANMKVTTVGTTTLGGGVVFNNQGTLDIAAGATLKAQGDFNLLNGSTLTGSGILDVQGNSKVVNQGTTRPGTSPGVLRILGDWSQGPGTTLVIEIFGPEIGTGHDQLVVTGRLTAGGALQMVGNGVYRPTGLSIPVATYGSVTGSFSISLTGGLTGLQLINYTLTELRMQF